MSYKLYLYRDEDGTLWLTDMQPKWDGGSYTFECTSSRLCECMCIQPEEFPEIGNEEYKEVVLTIKD